MPLISVIIPVYNSDKYLRECLNSVFSQTLKDFEIILIDDGSKDGSAQVYNSFNDKRLRIYKQDNKGAAYARNYAMSLALGKFIACWDSDDICRADRLEIQYDFITKHSGYSLVGSYCNVTDSEGNFIYIYNRMPVNDSQIRQYMRHDNPIITSSAFFRKDDALNAGGFYDKLRTSSEDFPLWVNLSKVGKVYNVPMALVSYRVVPASVSSGEKNKELRESFLSIALTGKCTEKQRKLYDEFTSTKKPVNIIYYDYYLILAKLYLFEGGKKRQAIVNLYRAIKLNPKAIKIYMLLPFVFLPCKFNKLIKDWAMEFSRMIRSRPQFIRSGQKTPGF